jgi:hypothetical protein
MRRSERSFRRQRPDGGRPWFLSFLHVQLSSFHADLRVSLREVREGQRNPDSIKGLEGNEVPPLWIAKAFEEVVGVCVIERQRVGRAGLHRKAQFVRDVRHRTAAFALICASECGSTHQDLDAFLERSAPRHLDPIAGARRHRGDQKVV